jgi:hypothetical protein
MALLILLACPCPLFTPALFFILIIGTGGLNVKKNWKKYEGKNTYKCKFC